MRPLPSLLLTAMLALAPLAPAMAEPATADQRAALETRIDSFDAALSEGDMVGIMTVLPPPVLDAMARGAGMTVEDLLAQLRTLLAETMNDVEFLRTRMDRGTIEHRETSDGRPYALIPTEVVMQVGEMKMEARSTTLALWDQGAWYLMRIEGAQHLAILRSVYPDFAGVEIPAGTMRQVE